MARHPVVMRLAMLSLLTLLVSSCDSSPTNEPSGTGTSKLVCGNEGFIAGVSPCDIGLALMLSCDCCGFEEATWAPQDPKGCLGQSLCTAKCTITHRATLCEELGSPTTTDEAGFFDCIAACSEEPRPPAECFTGATSICIAQTEDDCQGP